MYCAYNLMNIHDIFKNTPEIKLKDLIKPCTSGENNHERRDSHLPIHDFNYLFDRYFWTNKLNHYQM